MLGAEAANEPRIYGLVLLVFGRQGRPGDFGVLPFFVRKVIVLNIYGKNSIQCRVGGLLITDKLITDKLITKIYKLINYKLITLKLMTDKLITKIYKLINYKLIITN